MTGSSIHGYLLLFNQDLELVYCSKNTLQHLQFPARLDELFPESLTKSLKLLVPGTVRYIFDILDIKWSGPRTCGCIARMISIDGGSYYEISLEEQEEVAKVHPSKPECWLQLNGDYRMLKAKHMIQASTELYQLSIEHYEKYLSTFTDMKSLVNAIVKTTVDLFGFTKTQIFQYVDGTYVNLFPASGMLGNSEENGALPTNYARKPCVINWPVRFVDIVDAQSQILPIPDTALSPLVLRCSQRLLGLIDQIGLSMALIPLEAHGNLWGMVMVNDFTKSRLLFQHHILVNSISRCFSRVLERLQFKNQINIYDRLNDNTIEQKRTHLHPDAEERFPMFRPLITHLESTVGKETVVHTTLEYLANPTHDLLRLFGCHFGFITFERSSKDMGTVIQEVQIEELKRFFQAKRFKAVTFLGSIDEKDLLLFQHITSFVHIPLTAEGSISMTFFRVNQKLSEKLEVLDTQFIAENLSLAQLIQASYWWFALGAQEKQKAEQSALLKTRILGVMSHEVRTPLNAIINFLEMTFEALPSESPEASDLLHAYKASRELLKVINDILILTKIGGGKEQALRLPFNINELLNSCIARLKTQLSINLEQSFEGSVYVLGDAEKLLHVIYHLCEYCQSLDSDIKISFDLVIETSVSISLIIDGIPASIDEEEPKTFDTDKHYTNKQRANISLATIGGYIRLLDGNIQFGAVNGRTRLNLVFSFMPTEKVVEIHGTTVSSSLDSKQIVAIVADDNPVNCQVLARRLTKLDCITWNAQDGQEVLNMYSERNDINVIFMDMNMPIITGLEATRQIRKMEQRKKADPVVIIAVSGNVTSDAVQECKEAGMDGFLSKPLDAGILKSMVMDVKRREWSRVAISSLDGSRNGWLKDMN
ncbi:hypothetical protein EDD86DRAFT_273359 [Gorgonomyces haynaldii]|nr:hypothetical protein EDD86DRAFT_273359 [Gorgonomyces haynaldii]